MEVHVYDTYVKAKDGHTMHFDVITSEKDHDKALGYAKEWLTSIDEADSKITTEECQFCHSQGAPEPNRARDPTKRIFHPKDGRLSLIHIFSYFLLMRAYEERVMKQSLLHQIDRHIITIIFL